MQAERVILPCPVCGEDPEHGVTQEGKHVLFCNEHLTKRAEGQSKEEVEENWNRGQWAPAFDQENDPDEVDDEDADD